MCQFLKIQKQKCQKTTNPKHQSVHVQDELEEKPKRFVNVVTDEVNYKVHEHYTAKLW